MKKVLVLLITLLLIVSSMVASTKDRKKVGLVLSGGGAKGIAHVGALKVIREAGIPIDYIAGTSMGAIVGGMTALGYSPDVLDSIVKGINWVALFSDKVARSNMSYNQKLISDRYILSITLNMENKLNLEGLTSGQNVLNLLQRLSFGYTDSISFSSLPTPFSCVAYDMVDGKAIPLSHGDLPLAIRSSMSIPGVFVPVHRDGMVLIDGGVLNNFPVDVVRDMGADIVIGIDVGAGVMPASELNNPGSLLNQLTTFYGFETNRANIEATDLYIHPDVTPYTAASFSPNAIDTLMIRGENAVRAKWDELIALKEKIGVERSFKPDYFDKDPNEDKMINLGEIEFLGLDYLKPRDAIKITGLKANSTTTEDMLFEGIRKLQGSGQFSSVNYKIETTLSNKLVIVVEENSRNSLNLGLRFDTKEMAALLINATIAPKGKYFSEFDITTRLNENPYAKVAYTIGTPTQRNTTLSYMIKYTSVNLYNNGEKFSNIDFLQNEVDLAFSNIRIRNMKITAGARYEYFDYDALYTNYDATYLKPKSEGLLSLYFDTHYDSYDELYYPTRGINFEASYTVTSNRKNLKDFSPFGSIFAKFGAAISPSSRVTFIPGAYTRMIHGDDVAFSHRNFIGGSVLGRYFNSHMPFIGIHQLEETHNVIFVGQFTTRVRLWKQHYVSFIGNYANYSPSLFDLGNSTNLWGGGVSYSYNTVVGPVALLLDMSSKYRSVGVYFSFGYYF